MALTGFHKSCAERSGGVRSISLARASDIKSIEFDAATQSCRAVSMFAGRSFAPYYFREDGAILREEASWENGAMLVRHELSFPADPLDALTAQVAGQIADASRCGGLVAVVETNTGERFLVGYSRKFLLERPLKLLSSKGSTGARRADISSRGIVLGLHDCAFALSFTGIVP